SKIVKFLDTKLNTQGFVDYSINGLQVDSGNQDIKRISLAVDSGLSIIEQAKNSDLLICHHGLFWGAYCEIDQLNQEKVKALINNECSLYCSHLPLDGHLEYGNAAQIAKALNYEYQAFFEEQGNTIGVRILLENKINRINFLEKLKKISAFKGVKIDSLLFGKEEISKIGILTGSGSGFIKEFHNEIDLLITGEAKQSAYHDAKDYKINVFFAGHYNTETFGVKALGKALEKEFKISTLLIDEPTGI
ncbi:UNVERIFIED_CONTAM: hypothetical protein GTU68_042592, partial [Idotea baltica]|nr:hypothetical protein [Idotea baltica]